MHNIQVAVISDVHGNRWALEAVLEDIGRRGIRSIVNLGDSLYGPLAPLETAELLLRVDSPTVRGNEDRLIVAASCESTDSPTLQYVRNSLRQEQLDWLAGLELTTVVHEHFRLCHGSPTRDDEYLLQEVTQEGVRQRDSDEIMSQLADVEQPVVLCGHDHSPRTVRLPNGTLIVNPGSAGLPAYSDDVPHPHVMETGDADARYAVVWWSPAGWRAGHVQVAYDWESAAATAYENGRADWGQWLQSGRVCT